MVQGLRAASDGSVLLKPSTRRKADPLWGNRIFPVHAVLEALEVYRIRLEEDETLLSRLEHDQDLLQSMLARNRDFNLIPISISCGDPSANIPMKE